MKNRQKLKRVIMIFVVIINIFNIVTLPIPYRIKFDKSIAEELLKETYLPLVDFVKAGTPIEGEELLLAPNDIRNENDFNNRL